MLSSSSVEVQATASCDWLTRTFSDNKIRQFVEQDFVTSAAVLKAEGHETAAWSWMGYDGYSVGGLSWGRRDDGDILRASGGTAERMFDRFGHYHGNCSRLDVALTLKWPTPERHVASQAYSRLVGQSDATKRRLYSLITNSHGGETLYVGSRASDQFGRVYDKDAEQKLARISTRWRYEVEFKADRAVRVLELLQPSRERGKMYLGIVRGFFEPRGVKLPPLADEQEIRVEVLAPPRQVDTQLTWLRDQVRPVVQRLTRLGLEASVMEALRLEGIGTNGNSGKHGL